MTIPGGQGGIKTPSAPGSASVGPTLFQVVVRSVDPTATPPVAIVNDTMGREIPVRIDLQRGKGSIPAPGERWVIDKSMGVWTFACFVGGDPAGVGQFDVAAVSGLSDALSAHDDDLAAHDARLDTMFSQGTVTATQGTTATVTMTDGSVATGVQTVGTYLPTVGDTVWTGTVDAAGSKVALGTSADATSNSQAYDATVSHYLTTSRIREAQVNIWSDHRIAAGDQGTPAQYMISLFHADTNGTPYPNSELDLVLYGADNAALLKNDNYKTGMLWGNGRIYFTQNTGNGRIAIEALSMTSTLGGGMTMGADANGNASLMFPFRDISLVAGVDGLHVANAGNTAFNPLLTGPLTVTGQTNFNGGIIGNTGASLRGSTLQSDGFLCGPAGPIPTFGQAYCTDVTGTNNIAVGNTFFYKGVAQAMNPPSERALKEHIETLGDPWGFINHIVAARYRWLDPEHHDDRVHVGIYADEMAEADPDTVYRPELVIEDNVEEEFPEQAERWRANHGRHPEDRALLAYVVRALQDAHSRIEELEAVITSHPPTKE